MSFFTVDCRFRLKNVHCAFTISPLTTQGAAPIQQRMVRFVHVGELTTLQLEMTPCTRNTGKLPGNMNLRPKPTYCCRTQ